MSDNDPNEPMSLNDMRKVLTFLMSKLPDDQLAELDDQLLGETQAMAGDSRLSDQGRREYLRFGPKYRRAVRSSIRAAEPHRYAQDAADTRSFAEMFPNLNRLK